MTPLRVLSFESRRCEEMASLIRRQGGLPTVAPSMQEVPRDDNRAVFDFTRQLLAGQFDSVLFLTGVGARALLEIAEAEHDRESILEALRRVTIIIRGPKPAAVLREWNVPVTLRAPEPNTWHEVVTAIDASGLDLRDRRIAVQEYGEPSGELYVALRDRGAVVTPVPVYRWTLPDDTAPLEAAIRQTVDAAFDLVLFTSAQQVRHVLQVAGRLGLQEPWRQATQRAMMASIGPTCSEALREVGLRVDLEPSHPRMGTLVREAMDEASRRLAEKGTSSPR